MLQMFYNPNNAMVMDLSCYENMSINLNYHQLSKHTLRIMHNFSFVIDAKGPLSIPRPQAQGQGSSGHSQGQGQPKWPQGQDLVLTSLTIRVLGIESCFSVCCFFGCLLLFCHIKQYQFLVSVEQFSVCMLHFFTIVDSYFTPVIKHAQYGICFSVYVSVTKARVS